MKLQKLGIFMQQIVSLVLGKIICWDIEFGEIIPELDNGPRVGPHLGNTSSESLSRI